MVAIEIRFPGGRYHATPWGRDVNEGEVEWPPSPWRFVRALISVWHQKMDPREVDRDTLERLVVILGSTSPEYSLPPAVAGHTRHFMPQYGGKTRKVFDAFLSVADEPLLIRWPQLELEESERTALGLLVSRLGYLGRAESWTEARLLDESREFTANCKPTHEPPREGETSIELLGLMSAEGYGPWRESRIEEMKEIRLKKKREKAKRRGKDPTKKRLTKTDLRRIEEALPSNLYKAACADTNSLQDQGWDRPPGSVKVPFVRPRVSSSAPTPSVSTREESSCPKVARFALASDALPRLTEAISVAERIHVSLISNSDGHPVFTGRDDQGAPPGNHVHAYILPESHGAQGRITHVTVFAEMGFNRVARRALSELGKRGIWGHGGHPIQCVLVGVGQRDELAGWDTQAGACSLLVNSSRWRSRMPFVPTRFPKQRNSGEPKTREGSIQVADSDPESLANVGIFRTKEGRTLIQRAGPTDELLRFLDLRGYPKPARIAPIADTDLAGRRTRWLEFRTRRGKGGGRRGYGHGFGFEIDFPEPVCGPVALGYGAHFGLGRFEPAGNPQGSGSRD